VDQSTTEVLEVEVEQAALSDAEAADLADLLFFEETGAPELSDDHVRPDVVGKVVARLKDDATRGDGMVHRDDVNRAYSRQKLTIAECAQAEELLAAAQVEIWDDEPDGAAGPSGLRSVYLTEADERALARKIQLARKLEADQCQYDAAFRSRILSDADKAKVSFVTTNQRYVRKIAREYRGTKHLTEDDLYQEGMVGLLKATDLYDPDLGFRFKTYATWWIEQRINRVIDNEDREVRLPVHLKEQLRRIRRAQQKILLETGKAPNTTALANALGMAPERLARLLWRVQATECVEGDAEVGEDHATIFSFVPDEESLSQLEAVAQQELATQVREALRSVTPREERILRLRFGIDGTGPLTLEAIGRKFDLTRERIRQLEAKALRKLKHPYHSRKLRAFLE
jgi:RNA polymerase primary sigma factor